MTRPRPRPLVLAATVAALLALTACGGEDADTGGAADGAPLDASDWSAVLSEADGQSVNWYMYGGDEVLNEFVGGYLTDALAEQGVRLNQVRIADTAEAVNKVLGEKQAGRTAGGSVDAIWLNGENFATGVQADLWACGWPENLPNAEFVDFDDPAVATDFGVPVDGCEAVWQQANSALVYDSAALGAADVESVDALLAWAEANPGRFTYPAPPDFTGSMAVRSILYDTIDGPGSLAGAFDEAAYSSAAERLWTRLNEIEPTLWRGGSTYPQSQAAVEKLYADGEISAFFTYGPGAVGASVEQGQFPATTREAVPASGNIANVSFLAVPASAANRAAAFVLANELQDPRTQLALYEAEGIYPGIDLTLTDDDTQAAFAAVPVSPSVLPLAELTANARPELASDYITALERDWVTNVLQR